MNLQAVRRQLPNTRTEIGLAAAALVMALAAIGGSHIDLLWFAVPAGVFTGLLALGSLVWPRHVLMLVVLSPMADRYLLTGLLGRQAEGPAHLLSEALLLTVGIALALQAARRGTLRGAVMHPAAWFFAVFVVSQALSAILNGVPPAQAVAGMVFTLDAAALFVLVRIVGFSLREVLIAVACFLGVMLSAAVVALGQAVLSPHILGLYALQGRFGEVYRLASIFGDPNVFAAFLSAAIPFLLFAATALGDRRGRRLAIVAAAVLLIPLWLSFSRGGWVGAVAGFVAAAALIDRRALRLGVVLMVVTFAIAWLLPRDLLGGEGLRPDLFDATFGRFGMIGQGADLRTQFIHNALPIVQDHSLLGVGPGRYGGAVAHLFGTPVYHRYATDLLFINPAQHTVDDFWLHLLVESGAVGFGSFVAMIGAVLLPVARAARRAFGVRRLLLSGIAAATVCLAVNSLSTMMLEANGVGFVFWFLLGLGSLLVAGEDHRRDPERERHGP